MKMKRVRSRLLFLFAIVLIIVSIVAGCTSSEDVKSPTDGSDIHSREVAMESIEDEEAPEEHIRLKVLIFVMAIVIAIIAIIAKATGGDSFR